VLHLHAGELLEALQRAELDTGAASATIHEVAQKRVDALKLYLAATAVWHEEARRYVQVISSTESAAARAREAVRTEAQQEHAVAGPGSRNAELN